MVPRYLVPILVGALDPKLGFPVLWDLGSAIQMNQAQTQGK